MIDRCFNPDCRRKLHYLRDGRVVRLIKGKGKDQVLEHYWLCGPCYEDYNFAFMADGNVLLEPKPRVNHPKRFRFAEVLVGSAIGEAIS